MPADRAPRKRRPPAPSHSAPEVPYQAVLAAALDPIVTIDDAGAIQSASNSVERVFGWAPAELVGKDVSTLVPDLSDPLHDGSPPGRQDAGHAGHAGRAHRFGAIRKDGTPFHVEVSLSRVEVPGQASPLFVGIIRDLSEHAGAGDGGPAPPGAWTGPVSNSRLQELLAEQTAALQAAHLRLRMSDRLASIGALAAGLGHDLNNVLLPVRAHLEAARAGALVPEVRRHVDAVHKSVSYLQQLADGLHYLARDSEGDDSERAATDIASWWSQVGPLLTSAVPKHVSVEVSLPAGLPAVAVSAHGLTQAVLNLVVNAGEAIPSPGPRPTKRGRRRGLVRIAATFDRSGPYVVVRVSDNGQGMSEETQRRALEMFYTTKPRGLGTGLGLPLVARVVGRAGGSVRIESRAGTGTTVSLLLPGAGRPEGGAPPPSAVVAVTDGRAAAMIRHLLEATGIHAAPGRDPAQAEIWVTEPTREGLAGARAWRRAHPRGGLVVFGKPGPGSARAWRTLRPVMIERTDDLGAVRAALDRVISHA